MKSTLSEKTRVFFLDQSKTELHLLDAVLYRRTYVASSENPSRKIVTAKKEIRWPSGAQSLHSFGIVSARLKPCPRLTTFYEMAFSLSSLFHRRGDRMESRWTRRAREILRNNYLRYAKSYDASLSARWRLRARAGSVFCARTCGTAAAVAWVSLRESHDGCWTLAAETDRQNGLCLQRVLGRHYSCIGVDVSADSLDIARATHATEAESVLNNTATCEAIADGCAYACNGVFPYIAPDARPAALGDAPATVEERAAVAFLGEQCLESGDSFVVMSRCGVR